MAALFVDQLTVIDFSYFDHARGIVGESWMVDVELHGDLDEQGMVFDFSDVKKQLKAAIDGLVDHCFVVPAQCQRFESVEKDGLLHLTMFDDDGLRYRHQSPQQAVVLLPAPQVTFHAVKDLLLQEIRKVVPDNVQKIVLQLQPEIINGAFYHYSHGLKKHLGDCQRIAHGHRSRIQIWRDGERCHEDELDWAERWQDIYLATSSDLEKEYEWQENAYYRFAYQSQQGEFAIELPKSHCEMMPTDTTVELIATYIAEQLKKSNSKSRFKVKAYEGVNKGAIASA